MRVSICVQGGWWLGTELPELQPCLHGWKSRSLGASRPTGLAGCPVGWPLLQQLEPDPVYRAGQRLITEVPPPELG